MTKKYLPFYFFFLINSLEAQIKIDPNSPPNSLEKEGYNLIFSDDFDTFQADVWDISGPSDDGEGYDLPELMCSNLNARQAPKNVSNVMPVENGLLPLRIRRGEERNACGFSSAEIKTFSVDENQKQRSWQVQPNSYVEIRMRVPAGKGLGGVAWLYGPTSGNYGEIDIIETYGKRKTSFQTNFHTGPSENMDSDAKRVKLKDLKGKKVVLSDYFLTYAAEIEGDQWINFYVNNVLADRKKQKSGGKYNDMRYARPLDIRIGTGSTTLQGGDVRDCDSLPAFLYLDHVRVYQKAGTKAVQLVYQTNPESIYSSLVGGSQGVLATYYPKVNYNWTASSSNPSQKVTIENEDAEHQYGEVNCFFWATVPAGSPIGVYSFDLTVTFPSGYVEIIKKKIVVN
jgi:beta-glucanase (GH16 family)